MNTCKSVEEAEGQAVLLGPTALARLYRGPIIVETDNAMMAKEISGEGTSRSECFWIACEIKNVMPMFSSVQVKAIKRRQNKLAHELAARARKYGECLLIAEVPDALHPLMLSEYTD